MRRMYGRLIQGGDDSFELKTTIAQIKGISTVTGPSKDSEASVLNETVIRGVGLTHSRKRYIVASKRPRRIGPGIHLC